MKKAHALCLIGKLVRRCYFVDFSDKFAYLENWDIRLASYKKSCNLPKLSYNITLMEIKLKDYKVLIIVFLLGATIFSVSSYVALLVEKRSLAGNLEKNKAEIIALTQENQKLLQSLEKETKENNDLVEMNTLYKANMKAGSRRMNKLFSDLGAVTKNAEELSSQMAILKAENAAVRSEDEILKAELVQVKNQNDGLNARLNSLSELKKAIKELKKQKRRIAPLVKKAAQVKNEAIKAKKEIDIEQKPSKEQVVFDGNRGYILKNGKPVAITSINIEVNPASKN